MLDFSVTRHARLTVLQLNGDVLGNGELDDLLGAFALVPSDDQLVLELSEATALDGDAASMIQELLMRRAAIAQAVVISPRPQIVTRLVLHEVGRVSPIVRTMADALNILARPSSA
jgi:hypothetical protein